MVNWERENAKSLLRYYLMGFFCSLGSTKNGFFRMEFIAIFSSLIEFAMSMGCAEYSRHNGIWLCVDNEFAFHIYARPINIPNTSHVHNESTHISNTTCRISSNWWKQTGITILGLNCWNRMKMWSSRPTGFERIILIEQLSRWQWDNWLIRI